MVPVLQVVMDLAGGGRLGRLACGQSLTQVQALIGPFHERRTDRQPRRWRPRLHFWDDLELLVCHDMVIGMTVPTWRDTVTLPAATTGWTGPQPGLLSRGEVLPALSGAGIDWSPHPRVLDDDARDTVHVPGTGASLVFGAAAVPEQRRLHSVTVFHPEVDVNDHRPDQS